MKVFESYTRSAKGKKILVEEIQDNCGFLVETKYTNLATDEVAYIKASYANPQYDKDEDYAQLDIVFERV